MLARIVQMVDIEVLRHDVKVKVVALFSIHIEKIVFTPFNIISFKALGVGSKENLCMRLLPPFSSTCTHVRYGVVQFYPSKAYIHIVFVSFCLGFCRISVVCFPRILSIIRQPHLHVQYTMSLGCSALV